MDVVMYTVEEVAAVFLVSVYTVRRWIRSGALPAMKLGKSYRVNKSDLEAFLASREVQNDAP